MRRKILTIALAGAALALASLPAQAVTMVGQYFSGTVNPALNGATTVTGWATWDAEQITAPVPTMGGFQDYWIPVDGPGDIGFSIDGLEWVLSLHDTGLGGSLYFVEGQLAGFDVDLLNSYGEMIVEAGDPNGPAATLEGLYTGTDGSVLFANLADNAPAFVFNWASIYAPDANTFPTTGEHRLSFEFPQGRVVPVDPDTGRPVPEPGTMLLLGSGLLGLAGYGRSRRKA